MNCPYCKSYATQPLSTYTNDDGTVVTVHRCLACHANITVSKNVKEIESLLTGSSIKKCKITHGNEN